MILENKDNTVVKGENGVSTFNIENGDAVIETFKYGGLPK